MKYLVQPEEEVILYRGRRPWTSPEATPITRFVREQSCPIHSKNCSGLTGLVDSGEVAEFQHVELSPLHTAPDAVKPRDVGAFVVHLVQRPHEVIIAAVVKGHRGNQLEEKEEVEED